jgi:two-component system sensor histidine kinase KdpD
LLAALGQPQLPRRKAWNYQHYLLTALIVVLCGAVGFVAHALKLTEANIIMIFLAGVAFVAARFGRGPAIFAAVFGVLVFDFFFVAPFMSFAPSDAQYFVTFGVMLGYALLVSTLASRLHDQVHAAQQLAHRTAQLYRMTRELSTLSGPESLAQMAGQLLAEIFSGDVLLYFCGADGSLRLRVGEETQAARSPVNQSAAEWVFENEETAGRGTDTYFDASALLVPMVGSLRTIGVLGIRPSDAQSFVDPESRRMLETCASLIALSIERDQLFVEAQQAQVQVESEQLRNSFLSAVSHDLRTPLATIAVSASSLLEDSSEQSPAAKQEIVQTVVDESRRAARQVDNLLGMAQLHAGTITVHREWEVLEELVGVSLARLRRELSSHSVHVQIGQDVPLLWVAGDLIEQVLVNLLENAIRYTPAGTHIEISAERHGDRVEISVADNGPGLPEGSETKVFDRFFRGRTLVADGQRGIGLGLSICRAIVHVHGGEVRAANGASGGATFVISLPCPQESPQVTMDETSVADA